MRIFLLTIALVMTPAITHAATNAEIAGMLVGYVENCKKKMTFVGQAFIGKTVIEFGKGSIEQRRTALKNSDEYKSGKNLVTPDFCITIGYLLEDMGLSKATN
jgi:hypothetical protein